MFLERLKSINKNQVIVLVVALLLISVGYLNFSAMNKDDEYYEVSTNAIEYAGIGDAKLVSSSNVEEETNDISEIGEALITTSENIDKKEGVDKNENIDGTLNVIKNDNTVQTSSKENDEYFSNSKLNRQNMYSQMIETYQKILENDQISQDQKSIAQTEIKNINDIKNKIMICENLIKVKDIEDVIIFVNDESISVIVKTKELKQEQIAQIQNIISREMNAEASNIHISNK